MEEQGRTKQPVALRSERSTPWLDGLPQAEHPDQHELGDCPWAKFAELDHDSWAYRLDDTLVVRSHATAKAVMGDRRFLQGMSRRIAAKAPDLDPRFVERRRTALLAREGPDHLRLRRIASKAAFTPKAANRHRPLMREIMGELADQIPDDGVFDAVALIHAYPGRVIAHVLGLAPNDVMDFSDVVDTIFSAQRGLPEAIPKAWPALQRLDAHILEMIDRKRVDPGEDLITDLIRAETEDGALSTDDVHVIATAVVLAGTETTRNTLTRGLQLLAEHPEVWTALVDDQALLAAVEEILRFAPLAPIRRVTSEDLPVGDRVIPEGEVVIIEFGAANRDPSVVDEPHKFRIDRGGSSPYLTLGHGHKFCLGANLAKAEMVEALRVLRERFPRLDVVQEPTWISVGVPRGESMMLRFHSG